MPHSRPSSVSVARVARVVGRTTVLLGLVLAALLAGSASAPAADVFGGTGSAPGQFNDPRGIAVAPSGDVYVADAGNDRVERFSSTGTWLGHVAGTFDFPSDVAFSAAGTMYVSDDNQGLIQMFSPNGAKAAQWAIPPGPNSYGVGAIAAGKDNTLYQSDYRLDVVHRYTSIGGSLPGFGSHGTAPGQFYFAWGIAVAADWSVYVVDITGRVQRFSETGTRLGELSTKFGQARDVAVGPDGDVYVSDRYASEIVRMTPTGEVKSRYPVPSVGALALGPRGLVYVASGDRILRIDGGQPTPRLAVNAAEVGAGTPVQFDASTSSVPLGSIARYEWDLDGDGTFELDAGTASTVRHAYARGGAYTPAVRVTSQVGQTAVATASIAVTAAPAPAPLVPAPLGAAADDLSAAPNGRGGDPQTGRLVPARQRTSVEVGFKRTLKMRGTLVDAAGVAILGARIDVFETIAGGTRRQVATVVSDAGGKYVYAPVTRSNRVIELVFAARRPSAVAQSTDALRVGVRAGVEIALQRSRIPARGRVRMTGQVSVDGLPETGVVVEIRARQRGRWVGTGVARTDGKGRFRWSFRTGVSRGTFPLQARVLKDDRMPALPSSSRSVTLRVG